MDHWPERSDPALADVPRDVALAWLESRRRRIGEAVGALPMHGDWLAQTLD
jgi:tryptophan halogenase